MVSTFRVRDFLYGGMLPAVLWFSSTAVSPAAESPGPGAERQSAQRIIEAAGVEGGLVVHIGCGDGRLTAALRASDSYLVHGLDIDAENVRKARQHIRSLGLYGNVSVDRIDGGRLPYVDNLVNLVVSEDLGGVSMDEVLRVLCPGGVAYIKMGDTWKKTVKSRPAEIDEWTHFLHDAGNNAVSDDSVVGPPHQLQWVAGPKFARSHDHLASLSAAVSSGSRIFYIVDEAPIAAVVLEPKWYLVARDAFSGVILWKRAISPWQWHLRGFRSGPSDLARRLVAVDGHVYVTLGIDAPLSVLDAATGRTIATYEGTEGTLEVVYSRDTLFVVAGNTAVGQAAKAQRRGARPGFTEVRPQRPAYPEPPPLKRVLAIDAKTQRLVWKKSDADTAELMPTTLAVGRGRVFFQNADELICLDAGSGSEVWRAERPVSRSRPTWSAPTLVVYHDVVLSADRAVAQRNVPQRDVPQRKTPGGDDRRKVQWIVASAGGQAPVGELIAFSAKDGRRLWATKCRECYNAPVDVLVAGGLVWTGNIVRASDPGATEGRDPRTGQVVRSRPKDQTFFQAGMGHQRCYRNKATNRYLVFGRSGVEFIDLATGKAIPNHWTRGTCQYGVIPCNGLLYVPPHTCACFMRSKLNGFNCFAPKPQTPPAIDLPKVDATRRLAAGGTSARQDAGVAVPATAKQSRLERGPAYAQIPNPKSQIPNSTDWPTYRRDPIRSGRANTAVPADLQRSWETNLGGRLSSVVIAGGKLLVAQIDAHTVHALEVDGGRPEWSYTAGGRVDSPPSVSEGRVLFGSADGWVYCLRAADGALVWRFRAAPGDRRIVAYGQLESAWPVPGSVLVRQGVVYCTAGRSSYLDGAIRLLRLDAKSGRKLSETIVDHRDPKTGYQRKGVVRGTNMPGALPDVLSCDGGSVYMRHTRFDLEGQPQPPEVAHLFSATGFLDDTWWHRTYWMMGKLMGTNYGGWPRMGNQVPAGRLLVFDDSTIYGFGRNQYIHHGAHVGIDGATIFHFRPATDSQRRMTYYRAFAMGRKPAVGPRQPVKAAPKRPKAAPKKRRQRAVPAKQYRWTQKLPILARAMLLAPDRLFLAGPPDIFQTDDPTGALEGTQGGTIVVLSTATGNKLAEYPLEAPPVLDGMAAAGGRLYLATVDGKVLCFNGVR